ncbi:hypothetical protein NBRC116588_01650 [Pyruvatibacter sp. HU-CL02332]
MDFDGDRSGITLDLDHREPFVRIPHFGTARLDTGPAFPRRDQARSIAALAARTRYLRAPAPRAGSTFPRTRHSHCLPGIRTSHPSPDGPDALVAGDTSIIREV